MKRHIIASTAIALACQAACLSQDQQSTDVIHQPKSSVTMFTGASVIDGTGAPAQKGQFVVVEGKRIKSISGTPPAGIPGNARVIDAHGKTIIPALMVGHAHLGLLKGTKESGSNITVENDLRQLKQFGKYGICLVMSLGQDHDLIYDLRDMRNKGLIGGPYIMTAGRGFGVMNGAPPLAVGADHVYRPSTVEEARREVDDLAARHVDIIKLWVDDLGGKAQKMKPEMYKAIIAQAHSHGLKVAAHLWYLADAKSLVGAGIDVLAHSIRDLPVDDELISAMKSHGVYLIPTLVLDESFFVFKERPQWMNSQFFQAALEPGVLDYLRSAAYIPSDREQKAESIAVMNLKTLYAAGVKVGFGTDSGGVERPQGFAEHRELQLMVSAGLTPLEAIQCATQNTAEMLGVSKTMGTLAPGKLANLLVLDGDPSVDISNTEKINSVWIDGKEQK